MEFNWNQTNDLIRFHLNPIEICFILSPGETPAAMQTTTTNGGGADGAPSVSLASVLLLLGSIAIER